MTPEAREKKRAHDRAYRAAYRAAHPERVSRIKKAYYDANPEKVIARTKVWARRNPEKRTHAVLHKYGLTLEQVAHMYESQRGLCAICLKQISPHGVDNKTHIDHCHRSDKVRGLLCNSCNRNIATLEKPKDWLERAIDYLQAAGSL